MALGRGKFPVSPNFTPRRTSCVHTLCRNTFHPSIQMSLHQHGQWGAASGYSSIPQGQDIPGCVSSPSCPQGLEIAMTSSIPQPGASPFPPGWCPRNIRTIPGGSWHGKGREGTVPSSPTRLDFPHGISLLQTPPDMEDLLQPFLGNAPADTSECPGCAACHGLVLF